jgi:hypothetical protein
MRICDGALLVFLDGGGVSDLLVQDFDFELPEVDNFPRCVCCGMIFSFACG